MGNSEPRITTQTLSVIGALMTVSDGGISGAEIARTTNLASGSLYPILQRLEDAGWAESRWETEDPHKLGRPRRRLYQITGVGAQKARAEVRRVVGQFKEFAWR
jgi:DNA-binding PadR family transcriptional regulator